VLQTLFPACLPMKRAPWMHCNSREAGGKKRYLISVAQAFEVYVESTLLPCQPASMLPGQPARQPDKITFARWYLISVAQAFEVYVESIAFSPTGRG